MKKILTFILCVFIVMGIATTAFATTTATLTVNASKEEVHRGDEVIFTVSISEIDSLRSVGFSMTFDDSYYTMVEGSAKCIVEGAELSNFNYNANAGAYVAFFSYPSKAYSGGIFQFTLKVREDAPVNAHALVAVGSPKVNNGDISCTVSNVKISIICSHAYDNSCDTKCNICGEDRTITHTWDGGSVTTKPTCTQPGVKTYTCTVCGETKTEPVNATDHAYDNECDTECNNGCGTTREAKHDYSSKWTSDGTNHWHECSVCGDKADVTAHTPGPEATEWDSQTCTVCGKVLKEALGHTHKYGSEWIYDDMGHWYECSGCEELKDYSDHHYDNACDPDCNDCGSVRQIHHEYGHNMWFDASGHWQECIVCSEKTSPEHHEPGPEATEESAQVCTICGYELAPALNHTHEYGENWYWDGTGHWQVCSCGIATVREDHNWGEPIITKQPTADEEGEATYICLSCDAEKKEPIPAEAPTEPTQPSQGGTAEPQPKEFPVWILIVAGCVLALGLILFLIIGAIIGQKQKGKFSA